MKCIQISMFAMEKLTDDQLIDVCKHEFSHAMAYKEFGSVGHDYIWKECCELIGCDTALTFYYDNK